MKVKLICALYLAALVTLTPAHLRSAPPAPTIVRQVDHIVIDIHSAASTKALWSVFSEKLQLPVAWLLTDNDGWFGGGVNAGNVNLELGHDDSEQPSASARFAALGLEPEPLAQALPELDRLGLLHGQPRSHQSEDQNGNKTTMWTTVVLGDLSKAGAGFFLCEYNPAITRTNTPPARNIRLSRRYLSDQLKQRGGGPLGIESVKEIVIGASDYPATVRLWQKLLGPSAQDSVGEWRPASGPALRFVPSAKDGIESIVIRVASLPRARQFLQANGLLGHGTHDSITMSRTKLFGLNIRFVQ